MSSIAFTRDNIAHHHLLLFLIVVGPVLHAMPCVASSVARGYGVMPMFPPLCGSLCNNIGCSGLSSATHDVLLWSHCTSSTTHLTINPHCHNYISIKQYTSWDIVDRWSLNGNSCTPKVSELRLWHRQQSW